MAEFYGDLAGHRVYVASLVIPKRGIWTADVTLPDPLDLAIGSRVTLTIANLSLRGTLIRASEFQGDYQARLVGGAGKWRNVIPARSYRSPAGLKRGPILKDAAREAGEEINVVDDATIGGFCIRAKNPAFRILDALYPNWWVDTDGKAQIRARPTGNVATKFDLVSFQPSTARYEIATEFPASFMPGMSFVSPTTAQATANLVEHQLSQGKLRTVVHAA